MSQTYHSAVGHGALGFAGTFGALPPLWVSVRRLADLEDVPGGSGAVFAPIRCRTHAYTPTNKTTLTQNEFILYPPKLQHFLSSSCLTTLHQLFPLFSHVHVQFTFANKLAGFHLGYCYCSVFHVPPLSVGEGTNILLEEPQGAGKVPDERLRLLSALPRLRRGASHLHSSSTRCTSRDFTPNPGVQLAEMSSLTHRCRKGTIAFTDALQMQPFFIIARFH